MFNSIFAQEINVGLVFLMSGVTILIGVIYAFIVSFKLRSSKGFFVTTSLLPVIIAIIIALLGAFLSDSTTTTTMSRIATLAVALGLLRFRSVNGRSEEILILFGSIMIGFVAGLGYLAFSAIAGLAIGLLFILLISLPIFKNKKFASEKLLKITIPESLEYDEMFKDTFSHYLKESELVEVKTTGMGSLYRLSYRVILKNNKEEKEMIDELRIKNGNLEISLLPYTEPNKSL